MRMACIVHVGKWDTRFWLWNKGSRGYRCSDYWMDLKEIGGRTGTDCRCL